MHIDTNNFIKAVEEHPCLWNLSLKDHSDKNVKQQSWYEIGQQFFEGWSDMPSEEKDAKVIVLQKKWKTIRDYYVRTIKRLEHDKTGKLEIMRKKNQYFNNLEFLYNIKKPTRESVTVSEEHFIYIDETSKVESESSESILNEASTSNEEVPEKKQKLRETNERESLVSNVSNNRDEDSNKYFMLSLLPDMARMSERQNFRFRMEIMKALDRVKYQSNGSESS